MTFRNSLNKLLNLTSTCRKTDTEMMVVTLQVFLMVAAKPGISSQEILKQLDISQSSVSRHLALLTDSSTVRRKSSGYNYIEARVDPRDARNKVYHLSAEGRAFAATIMNIVTPEDQLTATDIPLK